MEITHEIKAKIFAQYLGQKFIDAKTKDYLEHKMNTANLDIMYSTHDWDDIKLVLTPLSEITDEDAIGVSKIIGDSQKLCDELHSDRGKRILNSKKENFMLFQYLQSKGYDLPNYLLGGKTLIESGLAINRKTVYK